MFGGNMAFTVELKWFWIFRNGERQVFRVVHPVRRLFEIHDQTKYELGSKSLSIFQAFVFAGTWKPFYAKRVHSDSFSYLLFSSQFSPVDGTHENISLVARNLNSVWGLLFLSKNIYRVVYLYTYQFSIDKGKSVCSLDTCWRTTAFYRRSLPSTLRVLLLI